MENDSTAKIRIGVLIPVLDVDPNKLEDEPARDTLITGQAVSEALSELGYGVEVIALTALTLEKQIKDAVEGGIGIFFNLCETLPDGSEGLVPNELDKYKKVRYTGSPAETLELALNKRQTKEILKEKGLPVAWDILATEGHIPKIDEKTEWPLFVKPNNWDGSVGIGKSSKVNNQAELEEKCRELFGMGADEALIEPFIAGAEFNIAFIGNGEDAKVLPVAEIVFGGEETFVSDAAKWKEGSVEDKNTTSVCPADIPNELREELVRIAKEAYVVLGCRGYGRVDIRVNGKGEIFILEVNPNCGIAPNAGFVKEYKFSLPEEDRIRAYALMVEAILSAALNRI